MEETPRDDDSEESTKKILTLLCEATQEEFDMVLKFRNEVQCQNVSIACVKLEEDPQPRYLQAMPKTSCFICNGFYGLNYEDPTCTSCHKFLFPNPVPKDKSLIIDSMYQMHSEDSDSGNDEPSDLVHPGNPFMYLLARDENSPRLEVPEERPPVEQINNLLPFQSFPKVALLPPQRETEVSIQALPLEVLMHIFSYLDDISLWAVGQVCIQWREVLDMYMRPEAWKKLTLMRWPLFDPLFEEANWYNVYTAFMRNSWCIKCIIEMAAQVSRDGDNFWRRGRLSREIRSLKQDPIEGIQAKPLDHFLYHWLATISGPIGSPYEGGLFYLYVQVPYSYPMNPPVVRFLTKIFHPNVSRHGDVGIDCIHHNWSLALTVSKVLLSIQSLLTDPFCDVCMEPAVGDLYLNDKEGFDKEARLWTWMYAMNDLMPPS